MSENCSVVSDSLRPHGLYSPWTSPGQNTGVGSFSLLQGSSQPRNQTQVSHIACRFFTSWATREAQEYWSEKPIPSPEELANAGIKPGSPALQVSYQGSPIHQENTAITNIYAPNIRAPKCVKQILTGLKGEIDNNKIVARDFNISSNEQIIQTENQKHWTSTIL